MPLTALRLADNSNSQINHLVLADKIPLSAIDFRPLETLHVILDGAGKVLEDGAHAFAYSDQGGRILNAIAVASEPGPAQSVIEVTGHGVFSLLDSRAEANLDTWDTNVLPKSIIEVRQVSTQSNSKRIDCWIVIQSARICS